MNQLTPPLFPRPGLSLHPTARRYPNLPLHCVQAHILIRSHVPFRALDKELRGVEVSHAGGEGGWACGRAQNKTARPGQAKVIQLAPYASNKSALHREKVGGPDILEKPAKRLAA